MVIEDYMNCCFLFYSILDLGNNKNTVSLISIPFN